MTALNTNSISNGMAPVRTTPSGTSYIEAGTGPTLILIHGVGMNREVWAPQIEFFARSHRVIAYDMFGHGDSPLPPDKADMRVFSDQLAALVDDLDIDSATLIGHSMGALVGLEFALRWASRVERLAALNAVYERSPAQRAAVNDRVRVLGEVMPEDILTQTLTRWFGSDGASLQPTAYQQVRGWLRSVNTCGYARAYACFAQADRELADRLGQLTPPALFLTGELDPNSTPSMSQQMAAEARRGRVTVLGGERHMMAFVSPARVNEHIQAFIQGDSVDIAGINTPARARSSQSFEG